LGKAAGGPFAAKRSKLMHPTKRNRFRPTLECLEARLVPTQTFTWNDSAGDNSATRAANWSVTGTGTHTLPGAGGTVVFDGSLGGNSNTNCNLDVLNDTTIDVLNIQGGYSSTITVSPGRKFQVLEGTWNDSGVAAISVGGKDAGGNQGMLEINGNASLGEVFEIQRTGIIQSSGQGTGNGLFKIDSGAQVQINPNVNSMSVAAYTDIDNEGTLLLSFSGGSTTNGAILYTQHSGQTITNGGTIKFDGANDSDNQYGIYYANGTGSANYISNTGDILRNNHGVAHEQLPIDNVASAGTIYVNAATATTWQLTVDDSGYTNNCAATNDESVLNEANAIINLGGSSPASSIARIAVSNGLENAGIISAQAAGNTVAGNYIQDSGATLTIGSSTWFPLFSSTGNIKVNGGTVNVWISWTGGADSYGIFQTIGTGSFSLNGGTVNVQTASTGHPFVNETFDVVRVNTGGGGSFSGTGFGTVNMPSGTNCTWNSATYLTDGFIRVTKPNH
jgi:hypothetical protein